LQVRFVAPEDGTIQYPVRGATSYLDDDDDRHNWRISRALINARDRHPNAVQRDAGPARGSRGSPPARRHRKPPPPQPSLTSPRVTALPQASDTDTQQNPLYGAAIDLFIY